MSIVVYWANAEKEWMRAETPELVSKSFYSKNIIEKNNPKLNLNYCPGFNENLKNLYAIKSIYDYSIILEPNHAYSNFYDQKFYDDHVLIRSLEKKAITFSQKNIFFTEHNTLKMTAYEYPFFEQNEITKRCILIPGKFDIGKWFRPLEFPFFLKNDFDTFVVNEGDIMYYVRFHTEEKIILKQFMITDKLYDMIDSTVNISINRTKMFNNFNLFYNKLRHKPLIIKEIKENLI